MTLDSNGDGDRKCEEQGQCLFVGKAERMQSASWLPPLQPLAVQVVIDCSFSMGAVLQLKGGARISAWALCLKLLGDMCAPPFSPMEKAKKFDLFVVTSDVEHKECASAAELLNVLYSIGPPHGLTNIGAALHMAAEVAKQRKAAGFRTFQVCFTDGDATQGDVDAFDQAVRLAASVPMVVFAYSPVDNKYWRNIVKIGSHPLGGWCINKVSKKGNSSFVCAQLEHAFERFVERFYLRDDGGLLCLDSNTIALISRPIDGLPVVAWPLFATCWRMRNSAFFDNVARTDLEQAPGHVAALASLDAATAVFAQRALTHMCLRVQVEARAWNRYWEKRNEHRCRNWKKCLQDLQAAEEARLTSCGQKPCLMRRDSMYADDDDCERCPIESDYAWMDPMQSMWRV